MSLKEGHRPSDRDIPNRRFTTQDKSSPSKWERDDSLTSINNQVAEKASEGKSQRHTHRVSSVIIDLLVRQTNVLSESLKDEPVKREDKPKKKSKRKPQEGLFLSE